MSNGPSVESQRFDSIAGVSNALFRAPLGMQDAFVLQLWNVFIQLSVWWHNSCPFLSR